MTSVVGDTGDIVQLRQVVAGFLLFRAPVPERVGDLLP
jgi:hypothetical protein